MADRGKSTRGRKRMIGKGHPAPSAADLFDSLIQAKDKTGSDEPKTKKVKRILSSKSLTTIEGEPDTSLEPEGGQTGWQTQNAQTSPNDNTDRSPLAGSVDSEASEDEGPCVLMSFGGTLDKDNTASPENSSQKRGRRPKTESSAEHGNEATDTSKIEGEELTEVHDNDENHEKLEQEDPANETTSTDRPEDHGEDNSGHDTAVESTETGPQENGGIGSLGVSKDVEDSIRKEIENMLANNRFRGGASRGDGADREGGDTNGESIVSLEEDVILVEAGRKKHCRFLIRRQEDQTPPSSRNYRCFRCSFNTTRMNNMIRHYREC